jgi:hypothetical protein
MIDTAKLLPIFHPLLAEDRLNELGPGTPNLAVKSLLQELERELPKIAKNRAFASACLAGLWLYHDFFAESHAISQDLDTVEGSYWHGILHRREPDYGNAKYWFRRVPRHPIFAELWQDAKTLIHEAGSDVQLGAKTWDSAAFVDLCESAAYGPDDLTLLCRRIQHREWELLFHFCQVNAFF